MTTIKIGKKDYKIFFAMEPTLKSQILSKLAKVEGNKEWGIDNIGDLFTIIAELMVVGLQKFHADEFGCNFKTGEGVDDALSKVFSLLDDFADTDEDVSFFDMFHSLENELLENGFFAKMFRQEKEKVEAEQNSEK